PRLVVGSVRCVYEKVAVVMSGLGWLGREGKISLSENDEEIVVTLV
ncbi:MAG: winged helix-turn-helix domain-containing protein, partial [Muribaculaceae bacterium]|nr:winged helix-turn-helix domain-containing protein [Muribaculaceae bacterium]